MSIASSATNRRRRERAAAKVERIGDGSTVTAEQFRTMEYVEQARLYQVNPERYRELRDGLGGDQ